MAKYDKYKKLVLAANLVKNVVTTSLNQNGVQTTAGPGNEGIEMVEWINERIDDGSIVTGGGGGSGNTNLSFSRTSTTVTVSSDSGTDAILPAASSILAGVMSATDKVNLTSLITLSGLAGGSNHLGTFTGAIIPDFVTVKEALQALETAIVPTSFPAGNAGDTILYYNGTWIAASPIVDKITNINSDEFTLSLVPKQGLFLLYKNGQYMVDPDDYTRAGNMITMAANLTSTDKMTVIYYN